MNNMNLFFLLYRHMDDYEYQEGDPSQISLTGIFIFFLIVGIFIFYVKYWTSNKYYEESSRDLKDTLEENEKLRNKILKIQKQNRDLKKQLKELEK